MDQALPTDMRLTRAWIKGGDSFVGEMPFAEIGWPEEDGVWLTVVRKGDPRSKTWSWQGQSRTVAG